MNCYTIIIIIIIPENALEMSILTDFCGELNPVQCCIQIFAQACICYLPGDQAFNFNEYFFAQFPWALIAHQG